VRARPDRDPRGVRGDRQRAEEPLGLDLRVVREIEREAAILGHGGLDLAHLGPVQELGAEPERRMQIAVFSGARLVLDELHDPAHLVPHGDARALLEVGHEGRVPVPRADERAELGLVVRLDLPAQDARRDRRGLGADDRALQHRDVRPSITEPKGRRRADDSSADDDDLHGLSLVGPETHDVGATSSRMPKNTGPRRWPSLEYPK
jgi:hypothetical protein